MMLAFPRTNTTLHISKRPQATPAHNGYSSTASSIVRQIRRNLPFRVTTSFVTVDGYRNQPYLCQRLSDVASRA